MSWCGNAIDQGFEDKRTVQLKKFGIVPKIMMIYHALGLPQYPTKCQNPGANLRRFTPSLSVSEPSDRCHIMAVKYFHISSNVN